MYYLKKIYKSIVPEKKRIVFKIFIRKFTSYAYLGNKVTCNCCKKKFKYFLPYGDSKIKRLNAACPWCQSLERTRMLWDFLSKSSYLKKNAKILHFAPANSVEDLLKKNKDIDYLSADINPALAMDQVDITNIKYNDNSFDLIICGHVLSVVKEDNKALNELYRVLKKGGTLIILEHIYNQYNTTIEDFTISSDSERIKLYGQSYLERLYGNDFKNKPLSAGFTVEEYNHLETLSDIDVKKYGMENSGLLFLCKK